MKSNFQIALIVIFVAFFVFAVLIFSGLIPIGNSSKDNGLQGKFVVWGTFSSKDMTNALETISQTNKDLLINYVQKPEAGYQQSLIEAFAKGTGPDLFF